MQTISIWKDRKNKSKKQGHLGTQGHNMDGRTSAFCDVTKGRLRPLHPLKSRTFLGRRRRTDGTRDTDYGNYPQFAPPPHTHLPHLRPWTRIPQSKKISNCRHQISVYTIQQLQSTQTEVQTVFDDDLFAFFFSTVLLKVSFNMFNWEMDFFFFVVFS